MKGMFYFITIVCCGSLLVVSAAVLKETPEATSNTPVDDTEGSTPGNVHQDAEESNSADSQIHDRKGHSIYDVISSLQKARIFLAFADKVPEMQPLLTGTGPYTVFVPSDDALVDLLSPSMLDKLDKEQIEEFIISHIVQGAYYTANLQEADSKIELKTLARTDVKFWVDDGEFYANELKILKPDVMAYNGVIHLINGTLFLPTQDDDMDTSELEKFGVSPESVLPVPWNTLNPRKRVTFMPPVTDDTYDGYGPSSINPNDYMPPEEGHVIAIDHIVKQYYSTTSKPTLVLSREYDGYGPAKVDPQKYMSHDELHSAAIEEMVKKMESSAADQSSKLTETPETVKEQNSEETSKVTEDTATKKPASKDYRIFLIHYILRPRRIVSII